MSHYKKSMEYFKEQPKVKETSYSVYRGPSMYGRTVEKKTQFPNYNMKIQETFEQPSRVQKKEKQNKLKNRLQNKHPDNNNGLNIEWKTKKYTNTGVPAVWGPAFWFTVHNGAAKYPKNASPIFIEKMKNFINGLPVMLPCAVCQMHATNHIESVKNKGLLDEICSGKEKLFEFFVDFHNYVNKRHNKASMSYKDAWKLYSGGVNVNTMSFK